MKKLIINADDFGLSQGVNKGVIEAHRLGVLTSASLMTNMPAFEEAVLLARENPGLGVGVHLNLIRGKPVSPKEVATLTDASGRFYGFPGVLARLALARFSFREIEDEFRAQIKKAVESGIYPTHLDTEKHLHSLPAILKILEKLAVEFKICKLRSFSCCIRQRHLKYKLFLLAAASRFSRRYSRPREIKTPDFFYSLEASGRGLGDIFSSLREGVSEIACHPGSFSEEFGSGAELGKVGILNRERADQLQLLLHPGLKDMIADLKVELINYSGL